MLDAGRFSNYKTLGLMVGERLLINTHGIVGYAALSSGSVRQLVDLLQHYLVLRTDLLTVGTSERDGEFRLDFFENRPLEDVRRSIIEATVLAIRNVLDFTTMGTSEIAKLPFLLTVMKGWPKVCFAAPLLITGIWLVLPFR